MRKFGKFLGRVLLALGLLIGGLWLFGPREEVDLTPRFDAAALPADLDAYLVSREARVPGITAGTEKRIIWAEAPGRAAPVAIVYLHGFSATSEEIRPVPDKVAEALGANLIFTRLAGHGRGGTAMAEPTAQDWIDDMAEALAIADRIGDRVFVITLSTGGTLAAVAANDPSLAPLMDGIIFVSPNFGLNNRAAVILDWPLARVWGPVVAGDERAFEPVNDAHAQFWTIRYPTVAVFQMAALVKAVVDADYAGVTIPALFLYSEQDYVVSPAAIRDMADRWGAPSAIEAIELGDGDDPYHHILAGDILSPSQTEAVTQRIIAWITQQ